MVISYKECIENINSEKDRDRKRRLESVESYIDTCLLYGKFKINLNDSYCLTCVGNDYRAFSLLHTPKELLEIVFDKYRDAGWEVEIIESKPSIFKRINDFYNYENKRHAVFKCKENM